MMKRLYLVRHAKSSWKNLDLPDIDRPLNKRGKRDAPFMGERLTKYNAKPDIIISSPAKRALTTAKIIAKKIGYLKEKIEIKDSLYGAAIPTILNIIHYLDDSIHEAILFGHNPEFTALANYLTKYNVENIPTCGIFCVDFEVESWKDIAEGNGIFIFFDFPKKHF